MAKSLRSKREKRLRAIRREIVDPFYQKKDEAKVTALEAAMAAPKLPAAASSSTSTMQVEGEQVTVSNLITTSLNPMDVEMDENDQGKVKAKASLKPFGGVGKKSKAKLKLAKKNRRGKGKIRGKRNL